MGNADARPYAGTTPESRVSFVQVGVYATRFEAELAQAQLESADMPSLIQSHAGAGVFGPGFQGAVPGGVALLVPRELLAEAKEILGHDSGDSEESRQ